MFTGIVEDLGIVKSISGVHHTSLRALDTKWQGRSNLLLVKSKILAGQKIGDSIAVSGACLTIADLKKDLAGFDVMDETLKKTTLGRLKAGDKVNLERALRAGDRLSGHFVTGHIDCVGKILEVDGKIRVGIGKEFMKLVVQKGSIALDGVSLTVSEIGAEDIAVFLIPHTIKNTTLGLKKPGDEINIEFDLIGKYAISAKEQAAGNITEAFLRDKGFCEI